MPKSSDHIADEKKRDLCVDNPSYNQDCLPLLHLYKPRCKAMTKDLQQPTSRFADCPVQWQLSTNILMTNGTIVMGFSSRLTMRKSYEREQLLFNLYNRSSYCQS